MAFGAVAALLAGGCATRPTGAPSDATPRPAAGPTADDPARWEADGGRPSPRQLAESTALYARTIRPTGTDPATGESAADRSAGPTAGPTADPTADPAKPSLVRFDDPAPPASARPVVAVTPARQTPAAVFPRSTSAALVAPPPPADPRAGVLREAVVGNVLASDTPQNVPESADFAPPLPSAAELRSAGGGMSADPVGARLARRARENPQDPAAQLDYQLYTVVTGGDAAPAAVQAQMAGLTALPGDDRDVVQAVVDGVSNYRSAVRANPNLTATDQARPLVAMVDRLRAESDLSVSSVTLCKRVDGFGKYDRVPSTFPLGRTSRVIVYYEVDNFTSARTVDGRWESKLTEQVAVYTPGGQQVVPPEATPRPVTDVCRSRRRDLAAFAMLTLPWTLPTGAYTIKLTVKDPAANKVAESDLVVTIGGAGDAGH